MDEPTPPPAPSPDAKPAEPAPTAPVEAGSGLAPNIAATICAVVPLLGGVIFLVLEKKNAFVRFWAMQTALFGGVWCIVGIVLTVVSVVFTVLKVPLFSWLISKVIGLVAVVFWIGFLVIWIVSIIKAFSNTEWEIPYLGKLARKQLAGEKLF